MYRNKLQSFEMKQASGKTIQHSANSNKTEAYNPETGLTEKVDSVVDQFRDADRTFKTLDNI